MGKTVAEAAAAAGQDPIELAFDLLLSERMGVSMISFSQSEEVVARVMREPYVNVCTDGLLGGRPHPRAYGSYPRILGRYVREQRVLTLEEAVRKMTSQAADAMHLADRGPHRAGPGGRSRAASTRRTVIDRATFADPLQPLGRASSTSSLPASLSSPMGGRRARGPGARCVLQPGRERSARRGLRRNCATAQ